MLSDKSLQISFILSTAIQNFLNVKAASTLTLGVLEDETTHRTSQGCSIMVNQYGSSRMQWLGGGTVNLYGCHLFSDTTATNKGCSLYQIAYLTMYNCICQSFAVQEGSHNKLFNTQFMKTDFASPMILSSSPLLSEKISVTDCPQNAIYNYLDTTFIGFYARNCTTTVYMRANSHANTYFYMVNADVDSWTFAWSGTYVATAKAYRQYTFDLAVADASGTAIGTATATLKDNTGTNVFSVSTDASGLITQQTVSRGYYNQANGNTLQDYGPFTLTVSKTGYITYPKAGIVLDKKMDWSISLHAQLSGDAAVGDVASGKKFYKDDADTQLTGTYTAPTLTGNAGVGDVASGKTFYKDDAANKLTGTLALTGNATINDVAKGKTFYNDSLTTKLTGALIHPTGGVGFIVGDKSPAKILAEKEAEIIEPSLMLNGILLIHNRRLKQINARLQKENFAK